MCWTSCKPHATFSDSRQAADYSTSHSRLAIICLVFALGTPLKVAEGGPPPSQNFAFASFDNPSLAQVIFVKQNSSWYRGQDASQGSNDSIWLNPDPSIVQTRTSANIGKMIYKDPIICRSPQYGTASFSTSFTFKITTTQEYPNCGSGLVFFIANYDKAPEKSYGRYLGMVSRTTLNAHRFFAVEFDTHITKDFSDVSGSHIAINVNSLKSLAVADTSPNTTNPQYYPRLFLYNNYTFTAWIEYNSSTNLIQVWATNSSTSQRPSTTCVNLTYDLSDVFSDTMFVGFSATNNVSDNGMEGHTLFSWTFATHYQPLHNQNPLGHGPNKLKLTLIIVLVIITGGIITCCICCFVQKRRPKGTLARSHNSLVIPIHHLPFNVPKFGFEQLCKATNNFKDDNLIGRGGYGLVYKGELEDGSTIAVKRLKDSVKEDKKMEDFMKELELIGNVRHKNLLQLQGWCYEDKEALFVYTFMSKGSLERYLEGGKLASNTRIQILVGVASALEYLHFGSGPCVLHRDVKAANVLLTDNFQPLLGDFGLARIISNYLSGALITMTPAGTTGYVAPEVAFSGKFSDKVDVYAFGVLALEVACGRRAIFKVQHNSEGERLLEWVQNLDSTNKLVEALDSNMCLEMSPIQVELWKQVLQLALWCCSSLAKDRPNMQQVCQSLDEKNVLLAEPQPSTRDQRATSLELNQTSPLTTESVLSAR
ncbi:hypothetical protein L7F22_060471 [Adiantum nelumboides]|nr:hypothetical protein [Adiantum nelumboides]